MIRVLLLILALFAAVLFAFDLFVGRELRRHAGQSPVTPAELHHGYIGAVLLTVGLLQWGWGGAALALLGLALLLDDAWQHAWQLTGEPGYQSPLHRLFAATLWRIPGVPWLCRQANALFARLCRARKPAT